MTARPLLSVVVASWNSQSLLRECLGVLRPQCAIMNAELIIVRSAHQDDETVAAVAEGCRLVAAPAHASLPHLRATGLVRASGEWVALTEDHVLADANWLAALMGAATAGVHVVGGRIGNGQRARATDCGAFFAEYGPYGGTHEAAGPPRFAAANVAYHHSIVAEVAESFAGGEWENETHDRLQAAARSFRFVPAALVRQNRSYGIGPFCRDRFAHGRDYAQARAGRIPRWHRAALFAATPLLPLLLAARIAKAAHTDGAPDFWRALPATLIFLSAWAAGEAIGYARGGAR